ncbi:retrotransposon protein, putative, ty1-copia subclass [Tanacetum coccineum]
MFQEIDEPQVDINPIRRVLKGHSLELPPMQELFGSKCLLQEKDLTGWMQYTILKARQYKGFTTNLRASRQWNKRFDDEIKKFGFTQNPEEPCVYLKASGSYVAILILYVDDILLMGNNIPMSKRLIGLNQSAYIEKILKRFYMENSKRGTIPMQEKLKLSKSQGASTPAEKQRMQNIPYASAISQTGYVFSFKWRCLVGLEKYKTKYFLLPSSTMLNISAAYDASKERYDS